MGKQFNTRGFFDPMCQGRGNKVLSDVFEEKMER